MLKLLVLESLFISISNSGPFLRIVQFVGCERAKLLSRLKRTHLSVGIDFEVVEEVNYHLIVSTD